jgi:hypothetical protein
MPGTTVPNFLLNGLSEPINVLMAEISREKDAKIATKTYATSVNRRIFTPIGAHKMTTDSMGVFKGNVDELYRFELGLENPRAFSGDTLNFAIAPSRDETRGWKAGSYGGVSSLAAYGDASGKQHAFVRVPERKAVVIILSDDVQLDAKGIADRIMERLIAK